jgi:hypothetical protein
MSRRLRCNIFLSIHRNGYSQLRRPVCCYSGMQGRLWHGVLVVRSAMADSSDVQYTLLCKTHMDHLCIPEELYVCVVPLSCDKLIQDLPRAPFGHERDSPQAAKRRHNAA